ncbi:hypothetical protein [uncultured Bradyrhizobium sp.]|jgi:hypothetical protein|uniref:hypothetical protein n=1 Tax=uncultured Bradyrhizobium sp. TaxID=199684 RepID=UPI00260CABD5|nr:hypothetical protein [uncultured Bradyrhizobium sp.]
MKFLRSLYDLVVSRDTAKELLKLAIGGLIAAAGAVIAFQFSVGDQDVHADMRQAYESHADMRQAFETIVAPYDKDVGDVQADIAWTDANYIETENPSLTALTGRGTVWRNPTKKYPISFFALYSMHRAGLFDHYLRGKDRIPTIEMTGMFVSPDYSLNVEYQNIDKRELLFVTAFGSYRSAIGVFQTSGGLVIFTRRDGKWLPSVCPRGDEDFALRSYTPARFYWADQTSHDLINFTLKYDAEYQFKKSEHRLFEFAIKDKETAPLRPSGAEFEGTVWSLWDGTCATDPDWNQGEVLRVKGRELFPTGTPTFQEMMDRAYQRGLDANANKLLGKGH